MKKQDLQLGWELETIVDQRHKIISDPHGSWYLFDGNQIAEFDYAFNDDLIDNENEHYTVTKVWDSMGNMIFSANSHENILVDILTAIRVERSRLLEEKDNIEIDSYSSGYLKALKDIEKSINQRLK